MTLAHLSDTHLGYFAYNRTHQGRYNQREYDVAQVFKRALDSILERDPDLVIHSGDFFHSVRPSNYSVIWAYRSLAKFQQQRGGKPLVIIGGNHDTPRSADTSSILQLFSSIEGIYVEFGSAAALDLGDIEVLCFPSKSLEALDRTSMSPSLGKKHSILTLHGVAKETNFENPTFEIEDTRPDQWTYAAYGDFHVHTAYRRNACYAGSLEYTSNNLWEEVATPKGWVWFNSEVGQLEHVPLSVRRVIDLPLIDATNLNGDQLGESMLAQARWTDLDLPIVRQRVINVLPETRRAVPISVIRAIDARCLHYRHVFEPPKEVITFGKASGAALSLETSWVHHIEATILPASVKRDGLKEHGLSLLKEVSEVEPEAIEA